MNTETDSGGIQPGGTDSRPYLNKSNDETVPMDDGEIQQSMASTWTSLPAAKAKPQTIVPMTYDINQLSKVDQARLDYGDEPPKERRSLGSLWLLLLLGICVTAGATGVLLVSILSRPPATANAPMTLVTEASIVSTDTPPPIIEPNQGSTDGCDPNALSVIVTAVVGQVSIESAETHDSTIIESQQTDEVTYEVKLGDKVSTDKDSDAEVQVREKPERNPSSQNQPSPVLFSSVTLDSQTEGNVIASANLPPDTTVTYLGIKVKGKQCVITLLPSASSICYYIKKGGEVSWDVYISAEYVTVDSTDDTGVQVNEDLTIGPCLPITPTPNQSRASVCGDGICDPSKENSDICLDCQCVDNGTCEAGEGSNCHDCGSQAGTCGSLCSDSSQCADGLACAGGACWDACLCPPGCGKPPEHKDDKGNGTVCSGTPVSCGCVDWNTYHTVGDYVCWDECGNEVSRDIDTCIG